MSETTKTDIVRVERSELQRLRMIETTLEAVKETIGPVPVSDLTLPETFELNKETVVALVEFFKAFEADKKGAAALVWYVYKDMKDWLKSQ